jgi:hypothetical protein
MISLTPSPSMSMTDADPSQASIHRNGDAASYNCAFNVGVCVVFDPPPVAAEHAAAGQGSGATS